MITTLWLVVLLINGETVKAPVPASKCPEIAMRVIQYRQVTTAWCEDPKSLRPTFTTVSM